MNIQILNYFLLRNITVVIIYFASDVNPATFTSNYFMCMYQLPHDIDLLIEIYPSIPPVINTVNRDVRNTTTTSNNIVIKLMNYD